MTKLTSTKRAVISAAMLMLILTPALGTGAYAAPAQLADPAFETVWNHCDKPVQDGVAARSWMWGPNSPYIGYEPYAQGPAGQHLVQYFDKSRMEINDPAGNRNSYWFVTNGLLVVDMMAGRVQVGDDQFRPYKPANIPVAGDVGLSVDAPTYASMARVASLNGNNRAPNLTGQVINQGLSREGSVSTLTNLPAITTYSAYVPDTGHNIADVFWTFMTQKGVTYHAGQYMPDDLIIDWAFGMGYPITEPYWIKINVSGQDRWVLTQAFQRRVLTYSPYNPAGWQVEMGNVGLAYYAWLYGQTVPAPTPVPPAAAAISLNPTSGDMSTTIAVTGSNFPAYAAVTIGVANTGANYYRGLLTLGASDKGAFTANIKLPTDAAHLGTVSIVASANSGAVVATAPFQIGYAPAIEVSPQEVVPNGTVRVAGESFPPNSSVSLGAQVSNQVKWLSKAKTDAQGSFATDMPVAGLPLGTTFKVVAATDNGAKATSSVTIAVLAQPLLQVNPPSGPANAYVTLSGSQWPAYRALSIRIHVPNYPGEVFLPYTVSINSAGTFSAAIFIGANYAGAGQVHLVAVDGVSGLAAEVPYYITGATPTPTPRAATVVVSPYVLAVGQVATVTGANWQAGAVVSIGVGRPGYGVEQWLTSAAVAGDRTIATTMALGTRWTDAGPLIVTAQIPGGKVATTPIWVTSTLGRVVPSGLPMEVTSFTQNPGSPLVTVNGEGWQPNSVVHISVISANGSVNTEVVAAVVSTKGTWSASFNGANWTNRPDLGVRASTMDGSQYSIRYLPVTSMTKVAGTSGTYTVQGFNWPANTSIEVLLPSKDKSQASSHVVRTIVTNASGAFSFTQDVPRVEGSIKNDVELRAVNQPYQATFDL